MIYHGMISYSMKDNFRNNRVIDNINYIETEETPIHKIRFDKKGLAKIEYTYNEWTHVHVYSSKSHEHCLMELKKINFHIKQKMDLHKIARSL